MKTSRRLPLSFLFLVLVAGTSGHVRAQQKGGSEYEKVANSVELTYPSIAQYARVQGALVIHVSLDEEGRVSSASVISGPGLLATAALENVKKWRFYASAQRNETIVFGFRLEPRACPSKGPRSLFQLVQPNFALIMGCSAFDT